MKEALAGVVFADDKAIIAKTQENGKIWWTDWLALEESISLEINIDKSQRVMNHCRLKYAIES
jgi:hypothetical protein